MTRKTPTALLAFFGISANIFIANISIFEIIALSTLFIPGRFRVKGLFTNTFCNIGFIFLSCLALTISGILNNAPAFNTFKAAGAYFLIPSTMLFLTRYTSTQIWIMIIAFKVAGIIFKNSDIQSESTNILSQEGFKFGFSGAAITLILTIFSFIPSLNLIPQFKRQLPLLSTLTITLLSLWGNLRLLTLNAWLGLLAVNISKNRQKKSPRRQSDLISVIAIGLIFPFAILTISLALSFLASIAIELLRILPESIISLDVLDKTSSQMTGTFGLIFGGRTEIFSAIPAWLQKPLFGWGGWAKDPNNYFRDLGTLLQDKYSYVIDFEKQNFISEMGSGLIPTHSALLNLVVWSGLAGAIPFYYFLTSYIRSFIQYLSVPGKILPYYISYSFFSSIWIILFSPIGYSNRPDLILSIGLLISFFTEKMSNPINTSSPLSRLNPD